MKKNSFGKIVKILFALWIAVFSCNFMFALELYKADAVVSYYGDAFQGKQTSSGEKYNMNDLTCANKSLPFGTILKVTNLANGKSVQVRVNDRGPFVSGRECDLSKAAAQKIDMVGSGTAHVKIEFVKKTEHSNLSRETAEAAKKIMDKKEGKTEQKPAAATEKTNSDKADTKPAENKNTSKTDSANSDDIKSFIFDIQVASFKDKANAETFAKTMVKKGYDNVVIRKSENVYRVVIKNIPQKKLADVEEKLSIDGYWDFVVKKLK